MYGYFSRRSGGFLRGALPGLRSTARRRSVAPFLLAHVRSFSVALRWDVNAKSSERRKRENGDERNERCRRGKLRRGFIRARVPPAAVSLSEQHLAPTLPRHSGRRTRRHSNVQNCAQKCSTTENPVLAVNTSRRVGVSSNKIQVCCLEHKDGGKKKKKKKVTREGRIHTEPCFHLLIMDLAFRKQSIRQCAHGVGVE